jgi:hypothetical protein
LQQSSRLRDVAALHLFWHTIVFFLVPVSEAMTADLMTSACHFADLLRIRCGFLGDKVKGRRDFELLAQLYGSPQ